MTPILIVTLTHLAITLVLMVPPFTLIIILLFLTITLVTPILHLGIEGALDPPGTLTFTFTFTFSLTFALTFTSLALTLTLTFTTLLGMGGSVM